MRAVESIGAITMQCTPASLPAKRRPRAGADGMTMIGHRFKAGLSMAAIVALAGMAGLMAVLVLLLPSA